MEQAFPDAPSLLHLLRSMQFLIKYYSVRTEEVPALSDLNRCLSLVVAQLEAQEKSRWTSTGKDLRAS